MEKPAELADEFMDKVGELEKIRGMNRELTIKTLEGLLLKMEGGAGDGQRASGASDASVDAPANTPAALRTELKYYKELFAKLRVSYVEQASKERFLRAVAGHPPLIVTARDLAELEKESAAAKGRLQAVKKSMVSTMDHIDNQARPLVRRHELLRLYRGDLTITLREIAFLEVDNELLHQKKKELLEKLRRDQGGVEMPDRQTGDEKKEDDKSSILTVAQLHNAAQSKRRELAQLNDEIRKIKEAVPARRRALARMETEAEAIYEERIRAADKAEAKATTVKAAPRAINRMQRRGRG